MTTPTTPPTPDRLREILEHYYGAWDVVVMNCPVDEIRALIADERRDARRLERECIALYVTNEGLASLGKEIRALPDEEPP